MFLWVSDFLQLLQFPQKKMRKAISMYINYFICRCINELKIKDLHRALWGFGMFPWAHGKDAPSFQPLNCHLCQSWTAAVLTTHVCLCYEGSAYNWSAIEKQLMLLHPEVRAVKEMEVLPLFYYWMLLGKHAVLSFGQGQHLRHPPSLQLPWSNSSSRSWFPLSSFKMWRMCLWEIGPCPSESAPVSLLYFPQAFFSKV